MAKMRSNTQMRRSHTASEPKVGGSGPAGTDHASARPHRLSHLGLSTAQHHGPKSATTVQRVSSMETGAERSPAVIQDAAAEGLSGSGVELPFRDRIQASFGPYSVDGIKAHMGGAASRATKQMGAQAYATQGSVVFGKPPDLHTAAHEVAHVMQQSSGVYPKDGAGAVGDAYERHADEVADAVVAGRSAVPILDRHPGGPATGPGADVQLMSIEDDTIDFGQANAISRSADGVFGVYFLTDGTNRIVVKPTLTAEKSIAGDAILDAAGVATPRTRMFDKASGQGASAIEALERLSGSLSEGQQRELSEQISGAQKVVVMGLVEGTSLKTMDRSKLKEAVLDPHVQMQIGKVVFRQEKLGQGSSQGPHQARNAGPVSRSDRRRDQQVPYG